MSLSFFNGSDFDEIMQGWEAKQNHKGVIYYVNNNLQITSWMHPYLNKILDLIGEKYSLVKYAAYRTSLKLRAIQARTGIEWMSMTAIKQVFTIDEEQYKEVSCSQALDLIKETLVLSDPNQQHEAERLGAAEVILNLMLCLFDVKRTGKMLYRSIGIALTALCKTKLNDKYRYFFTFIKDEENKVRKESLLFFIKDLMQISGIIKESLAFGTSAIAAVESCMKLAGKPEIDWVSEEDFFSWLLQEPQTFVWLPTLHRIQATENVAHHIRCFVCQVMPIIGFRYRCLQCFNYNLCQNCFLHGLTSLQHKLKHPMKEYCFPTTTMDNTKAFLDILKNKLIGRHGQQLKTNYLTVEDSGKTRECLRWEPRYFQSDPEACTSASTDSGLAICSDNGDVQDIKTCAFFEEDEIRARKILPCSTSSPIVENHHEQVGEISKHDIEVQQKEMANKIKQLQEENRLLQIKLQAIQKKYDLDKSSLSDAEVYMDYSFKISCNSSLSPVCCNMTSDGDLKAGDVDVHHDTLSIVGPITPIQSLSSNKGEAISSLVTSSNKEMKLDQNGNNPTSKESQEQSTQGTVDNEKPNVVIENDSCDTVLSNQLIYQSCDMSLTFEDTKGYSLAGMDRKSIPNNFTDKPSVVNVNKPCFQMGTSESQSELVYQSCEITLKVEETVENFLKETTEESKDPVKTFNQPCVLENDKNKETLYQKNPEGRSQVNFLFQTRHSISESSTKSKLPYGTEASILPNSFEKGQPHLVFSSSKQSSKLAMKGKKPQLRNSALFEGKKPVDSRQCHEDKTSNTNSSMCIEMSEIFPSSVCVSPSYSHHHHHLLNSTQLTPTKTKTKKMPMDPVHMSTPVHANQLHSSSHFNMVKKMPLSNYCCSEEDKEILDENKENITLGTSSVKKTKRHPVPLHGPEITPLSSIPYWHRKRILLSCNSVPPNRSIDATATGDSTGGLTQLFQKADHIGELINRDVSDMATEDMDEFEKLIMEFEKECINGQPFSSGVAEKRPKVEEDSDVLKAVNNLGDAMLDLVQATAKY